MPETDPSWNHIHETYSRKGQTDPGALAQASGEIVIAASPRTVWDVLTDVTRWPEIRSDIGDTRRQGPVASDVLFTWSTQGVALTSRFGLVVPVREVSWSTTTTGLVMSVHYLLERHGDGTTLKCHEALSAPNYPQIGGSDELRARVHAWLDGLKTVAERGSSSEVPA